MGKDNFVKAGVLYTIGNILIKGIGFLTIPIFTRLMLPEDYGIYNVFLSYVSFATIFFNAAYHTNLKNAKYDFADDFEKYSATCFFITYIGGLAFLLLFCGFSLLNLLSINSLTIVFITITSVSHASIIYYNNYLSLKVKTTPYLLVSLFHSLVSTILSILFIKACILESTATNRMLGVVVTSVFIIIYISSAYIKNVDFKELKRYLKYGLRISVPLLPHAVAQIVLNQFDRMMISEMDSFSAAGIYSFATNVSSILLVIASSCDTAWTPWFFEKINHHEKNQINQYSKIYVLFFFVLSVGLIFISPEIIYYLAPQEYADSNYCVIPLIQSVFFTFLYYLPVGLEYFLKKTFYISIGTVSAAVLNVILNYITIKFFGYKAAAYTTAFCYFVYFIFHMIIAKKLVGKFEFAEIFNAKYLFCIIFLFIALSIIATFLIDSLIARWSIMVSVCVPMALYCYFEYKKMKQLN